MNILRLIFCFLILNITLKAQVPFIQEIRKFEQADSMDIPVKGQIMLYGSSTLRLWDTYANDFSFKDYKIINRGFGGSQMFQAVQYFERVVVPHKPKWLFVYEGDNDINAGKTVEQVTEDFKAFLKKVKELTPKTKVVFFAIKPSSSRLKQMEQQKQMNKEMWRLAKTTKGVYYLDTYSFMLTTEGVPNDNLFKNDKLHMNADGYALWTKKVQWFLKKFDR